MARDEDEGFQKCRICLRQALILQAAGVRLRQGHELVKSGEEQIVLALGTGGTPVFPLEAKNREILRLLREDPLVEMSDLEILSPGVIRVKVVRYRWEKRIPAVTRILKFSPLRCILGRGGKEP